MGTMVRVFRSEEEAGPKTGLDYNLANNAEGSDIRLIWDGSALLPRIGHTVIARYTPGAQPGYYGGLIHSPNNGTDTWDNGDYSWLTVPHPCTDGSVDGDGQRLNPGGDSGETHFWEQAGLDDALDRIASPGGSAVEVEKDVEYILVRKCRQIVGGADDGKYEHVFKIFLPDGTHVQTIRQVIASITDSGANRAFYLGSSDWRKDHPDAGKNDENAYGKWRGFQLYADWLDDEDDEVEMLNDTVNTPQTAAGLATVHYMNQNPTPSDWTDKSGQGNDPRWANDNRPSLWTV